MLNDKPKGLHRIGFWLELVASLGAAIAVLWGAVMLFNPIGKTDLTVRILRQIPVSLPSDVGSLPIRLVYEGRDIGRASIVQIEIFNSGSTPIGEPEKNWKLDLRNRDGVRVVPLGPPRAKPANVNVHVARAPSSDVISLEIGLFNPGDSVGLDLVLVEPKDSNALPVVAETRIPGLSQPYIGTDDVYHRLLNAFALPIVVVTCVTFFVGLMYERRQLKRLNKPAAFAHTVLGAIVMSFWVGLFLGTIITGVIAWCASIVLTR